MKSDKFSFDFLTCSIWGVMALTVLSGIFLAVYYVPAFSQAFSSLRGIREQIPFGWMFRRLHAAGGSFLLLLLLLHLARVFYAGAYKTLFCPFPRRLSGERRRLSPASPPSPGSEISWLNSSGAEENWAERPWSGSSACISASLL
jgi:hypothetical protein